MSKLLKSIIDLCYHPKNVFDKQFYFKNFHVNIKIEPREYRKDCEEIYHLIDDWEIKKARLELEKLKTKWGLNRELWILELRIEEKEMEKEYFFTRE